MRRATRPGLAIAIAVLLILAGAGCGIGREGSGSEAQAATIPSLRTAWAWDFASQAELYATSDAISVVSIESSGVDERESPGGIRMRVVHARVTTALKGETAEQIAFSDSAMVNASGDNLTDPEMPFPLPGEKYLVFLIRVPGAADLFSVVNPDGIYRVDSQGNLETAASHREGSAVSMSGLSLDVALRQINEAAVQAASGGVASLNGPGENDLAASSPALSPLASSKAETGADLHLLGANGPAGFCFVVTGTLDTSARPANSDCVPGRLTSETVADGEVLWSFRNVAQDRLVVGLVAPTTESVLVELDDRPYAATQLTDLMEDGKAIGRVFIADVPENGTVAVKVAR